MKKSNESGGVFESVVEKIGELTKVQRYVIYFGTIIVLVVLFYFVSYGFQGLKVLLRWSALPLFAARNLTL